MSFGDTLDVTGTVDSSGDESAGSIGGSGFSFTGSSGAWFDLFNNECPNVPVQESFGVSLTGTWTLDGLTGDIGYAYIYIVPAPFAFPQGSCSATGIPATWTGDISLVQNGAVLYEISFMGTGTVSFSGVWYSDEGVGYLQGADASLTGEAQIVPEPGTLTLLGIGSVFGIRLRRRRV